MSWSRQQQRPPRSPIHICYRNKEGIICPPNAKQAIAHASPAEQIFYGGAAYGGKSIWLLISMLAFLVVQPRLQQPIEAALFRRYRTQLHQSLIPLALGMLPKDAYHFNSQIGQLTFRHNGAILWFLHCASDSKVTLYQSSNWRKLGIDESSHMTQYQVDYLTTRVRGDAQQVAVLMGSNPGGPGHGWLKRRFVRPSGPEVGRRQQPKPMEVWRPLPPPDSPNRYMATRVFIPAFATDNIEGLAADPNYVERNILPLGGSKARQLAYGDWDSNDGMMFGPEWEAEHIVRDSDSQLVQLGFQTGQQLPWHVIPNPRWRPPASATIYGSIDYGYGAPWAFYLHAILPGGHIRTFFEFYQAGIRDREQARLIRIACERLMAPVSHGGCGMQKPSWMVYDPQMDNSRAEVGLTETIADVYRKEISEGIGVELVAGAKSSRISRIQRTKDALSPAPDGFPWWQITEACPNLIRTLPEIPVDPDDPEEMDEEYSEDHAYESCSRFLERRPIPPRVRPYSELDELDPISRAEQMGVLERREGVVTVTPINVTNFQ